MKKLDNFVNCLEILANADFKNTRAIAFYNRHGFQWTGTKQLEAGTTEYLLELRR